MAIADLVLRVCGWRVLALNSDPLVFDRFLFLSPWLVANGPAVRTLDAGCGNGVFAFQAAHSSGGSVLALSDDEPALRKAASRASQFNIDNVEFRALDLRDRSLIAELGDFDQIILFETIEHVLDDAGLVEALGARLRVGGRLLLTTPSDDHPPLYGEGRSLGAIEDGRHVRWGYPRSELQRLVEEAGLEVTHVQPVGGVLMRTTSSVLLYLSERLGRSAALVATAPLRLLRPVDTLLTHILRLPSQCWGVVAIRR